MNTVQTKVTTIESHKVANQFPDATKLRPFTSLSSRLLVTLVAVGFLSAVVSGIFYQLQINHLVSQNLDAYRASFLERVEGSRLAERVKEQVVDALELRRPNSPGKIVVSNWLDQAGWAVGVVAVGASLLAFGLGWLLTRRIVNPLRRLRQASRYVAQGDFSQRVSVKSNDEVGQVAYSFNFMAAELQAAETKRRQLLSDVAHELKTPLASIQGHIEALRDNLPRARANPDAIYSIVLEDVAELDRLVGSLRTWLNAQSLIDNLEIKPLNLDQEVTALMNRFQPRAATKQVELVYKLDPGISQVLADQNALRHILANLLDNALRYTPAGGQVQLLSWPGAAERPQPHITDRLTLAVADTGCGIAPEHWSHLFERFYRVDKSRGRDTGGTGLGLALVKELTEAQGGRVWLKSQFGRGTIFFVTLPVPPHIHP